MIYNFDNEHKLSEIEDWMDYCNYWLSFDFTEKKRTKNIYEVSSIFLNLVFHLMSFSDFFPSYKSVRVLFFILLGFLFAWVLTHNHKNDASKLVLLGLRFSKKQPKKRRDIFWTKNEKKKMQLCVEAVLCLPRIPNRLRLDSKRSSQELLSLFYTRSFDCLRTLSFTSYTRKREREGEREGEKEGSIR